jgi:hypothetical protein
LATREAPGADALAIGNAEQVKADVMQVELRAFVPAFVTPWASAYRASLADWVISYRPEKHYMRGPGPKWREKQLGAAMPPEHSPEDIVSDLHRLSSLTHLVRPEPRG